jgi:hypothetical protein
MTWMPCYQVPSVQDSWIFKSQINAFNV